MHAVLHSMPIIVGKQKQILTLYIRYEDHTVASFLMNSSAQLSMARLLNCTYVLKDKLYYVIRLEVIRSLLQDNIQWLRQWTPRCHEDDWCSGRLEAILNFCGMDFFP